MYHGIKYIFITKEIVKLRVLIWHTPGSCLCSIFYVKCNITILLFIFQLISLELIYLKWNTYTGPFKYLFYKIFQNNITLKTCQRFFTNVSPQMHFKCASVDKMIVTMDAIKWLFFSMIHGIKCIYIIIETTLHISKSTAAQSILQWYYGKL